MVFKVSNIPIYWF